MSKHRYPKNLERGGQKITERGHMVADVFARRGVSQHSL